MKPIKYEKTPIFKTYEGAERIQGIQRIVEEDERGYKQSKQYNEFYNYAHANPSFSSQVHYLRYMNTAGVLFTKIENINGLKVVETGGASPLSAFLSLNNECFTTETDLRKEIDAPDSFADLIICCEVFEHIKDHEPRNFDELTSFQSSGAKKLIAELFRTLKPGAYLLLTTPNPSSHRAILNALQYKPSYIFRGHVREYTKGELLELFADFELVHYETQNNFSLILDSGLDVVMEKFSKLNWSNSDRGDNHIMIFRKPT